MTGRVSVCILGLLPDKVLVEHDLIHRVRPGDTLVTLHGARGAAVDCVRLALLGFLVVEEWPVPVARFCVGLLQVGDVLGVQRLPQPLEVRELLR